MTEQFESAPNVDISEATLANLEVMFINGLKISVSKFGAFRDSIKDLPPRSLARIVNDKEHLAWQRLVAAMVYQHKIDKLVASPKKRDTKYYDTIFTEAETLEQKLRTSVGVDSRMNSQIEEYFGELSRKTAASRESVFLLFEKVDKSAILNADLEDQLRTMALLELCKVRARIFKMGEYLEGTDGA